MLRISHIVAPDNQIWDVGDPAAHAAHPTDQEASRRHTLTVMYSGYGHSAGFKKLKLHLLAELCLFPWLQIPHIVAPDNQIRGTGDPKAYVVDPADPEAWRAQIFRSIDSDSAHGMPMGHDASALGLDSGKGKVSSALSCSIDMAWLGLTQILLMACPWAIMHQL